MIGSNKIEKFSDETHGVEKKLETKPNRLETVKDNYKDVINWREKQYKEDLEKNPDLINLKSSLDVHNDIVLGYAVNLCEGQSLKGEQKTAAIMATILHDVGKLSSKLLEHHVKGSEYAEQAMDEIIGKKFEEEKVTPETKQKVMEAIERHMNHPYLIMANNNQKFPEPVDKIDRIVFDADMLANIGFKNVSFRLTSEQNVNEDRAKASETDTSDLEESFRNVIAMMRLVEGVLLSDEAQKMGKTLIGEADKIYEYFSKNGVLKEIQDEFLGDDEWNLSNLKKDGKISAIKKRLNEEIERAGEALEIDSSIVKNFLM